VVIRISLALTGALVMGTAFFACSARTASPTAGRTAGRSALGLEASATAPLSAAPTKAVARPRPAATKRPAVSAPIKPATHTAASLRARLREATRGGFVVGPRRTAGATVSIDESFRFQGKRRTVRFSVPVSDLAASEGRRLMITVFPDESRDSQLRRFWTAVTNEPHQAALYDSLAGSLRAIRRSARLSADEYVELMAAYVQQMPYDAREAAAGESNRYPVVTAFGGTGVCGDRSILLAGLLAHEGYRVSLLEFEPESHMSVGIGTRGPGYRGTHLAFVETTGRGLVGEVGKSYGSGGAFTLRSKPLVIPIAKSGTDYRAGDQVSYILARERAYESAYKSLGERIDAARPRLNPYDASAIRRFNAMVSRLNRAAATINTVADHADDREALYVYAKGRGAP
jgi:hypothetical protein